MFALFHRTLWFGLLAATAGMGLSFAEGAKGRPIEYSKPRQEEGKPESNPLIPSKSRLDQWESELNNPFKSLLPGKSLDGMIMPTPLPMPPPVVSTPRSREADNNRRDWMFRTPEEMFSIQTLEDKYKAPELTADGRNRKEIRPMERAYLDALDATWSAMATNGAGEMLGNLVGSEMGRGIRPNAPGGSMNSGFPNSASGNMSQTEESIRRAFGIDSSQARSRSTDVADFFKFDNQFKVSNKPTEAEIQRMKEFKQILDFNNTLPESAAASSPGAFSSPYVDSSFFALPQQAASAPTTAKLGGGLTGSTISGAATPAWNPAVSTPAPSSSSSSPAAPSPFITIPRRGL